MKVFKKILVGLNLLFILLVIILPVFFIYTLAYGNPVFAAWVEHDVEKHLTSIGYTEEQLLNKRVVQPKDGAYKGYYQAWYQVTFKDEPDIIYTYSKKKYFGGVVQFCKKEHLDYRVIPTVTKHSEATCLNR